MNTVLISPQKEKPRFVVGVVGSCLRWEDSAGVCPMQKPIFTEETEMGVEDRVKGLETITNRLDTSVSDLAKKVESLSKSVEAANKTHPAVPILISLVLGWIGWLSLQVISHGNKLTSIGAILSPQETLKSLTSAVSPDPQKAKIELAEVKDSFRTLNKSKINLPEQTVNETTERLTMVSTTHKDLPETWSAIGAFITYRSEMIRGWQETNLPPCDDQFHHATFYPPGKQNPDGSTTIEHGPVEVHDCKLILDSFATSKNLSVDLSIADIVFTHCAIFYDGGPIVLVPVKMSTDSKPPELLGSLTFRQCIVAASAGCSGHGAGAHTACQSRWKHHANQAFMNFKLYQEPFFKQGLTKQN